MKKLIVAAGVAVLATSATAVTQTSVPAVCERTVTADLVVLDQPLMFNRIGAQNVNGMVFALRDDVVSKIDGKPESRGGVLSPGAVELRRDKRPRPIVLRIRSGDCLQVNLQNFLSMNPNPNNASPRAMTINDQVFERMVGFNPTGLNVVNSINDTSSFVGRNENSLVAVGQSRSFTFYGEHEGVHLVMSHGASFGGEATGGNLSNGMFGAVVVEPRDARMYRSEVTEEDMRLATTGTTPSGHPIVDYEATYPNRQPWIREGKAGKPILAIHQTSGGQTRIVHSTMTAIIAGPNPDGSFPASTYPLESIGKVNPAVPNRLEAFREFVDIFNDETVSKQAFPSWYEDEVFAHTLHGVGDHFMINQGSGGIGSQIIANRLGAGPMHDCLSCQYEEFFLSAFSVGDPAMLVDTPANTGLEFCSPQPGDPFCERDPAVRARYALYPDDVANVHHSYQGDFVKFRNLHAGPKEHHVFHLHNHQWLFNPNDENSSYNDAQSIGPGGAYTYEIAFGGSGNRNKTAGDAIFHCHFYPHFAQGMWALWRTHDTFEPGTRLKASDGADGFHTAAYALHKGEPASGARALPDGEIVGGTPIPAIVPLPGKALPPMPGRVTVEAVDKDGDGTPESSQAVVDRTDTSPSLVDHRPVLASLNASDPDNQLNPTGLRNPGFPFWIAGIEGGVGQRAPTPPLDMFTNTADATAGGWDGGLPRHYLDGYKVGGESHDTQTRWDFSKEVESAKAIFVPETGTLVERAAMSHHSRMFHPTYKLAMNGLAPVAASFRTNGNMPNPGSPFFEPCIDDEGTLFRTGTTGKFLSGTPGGLANTKTAQYGADTPRVYKAAVIQTDVVFNKAGDHYPQQRIITLYDDVAPTLNKTRPPEPFVMRLNSYECANFFHTNLVPEYYELDDYQVRTPTDIIGQHIHLPKWDLVSADGSSNGWNYEDGTLGAETVRNRITAINHYNLEHNTGAPLLAPKPHPYFGSGHNGEYLGARTTTQRWFVDPLHNTNGRDRGLGVTFTHDHFGPSTHQQIGLYATLLINPAGSRWLHNETGVELGTRHDGGPTSWQSVVLAGDLDGNGDDDSYREFYIEAQDFAHAYSAGAYVGRDAQGNVMPPTADSFRYAINPSHRQSAPFPDAVRVHAVCPGGLPRPCPEAISAADIGTFVMNYRNEPVGYRVYNPNKIGPDGKPGMQADGLGGDLSYALQTRTDRAIPAFNTQKGNTPYPLLTGDVRAGDPFTPTMRTVAGDAVRVHMQSGGHEHEHVGVINGVKWLWGGSAWGWSGSSGWRSTSQVGISEKATFSTSILGDIDQASGTSDHLYAWDGSQEGLWTGSWGLVRSYDINQTNLHPLPNNNRNLALSILNRDEFQGVCPATAPVVNFDVTAVAVNSVIKSPVGGMTIIPTDSSATMHVGGPLDPNGGSLRYNSRATRLTNGMRGPLHDPTALVYVPTADLQKNAVTTADTTQCSAARGGTQNLLCPVKLPNNYKFEPIVLRAEAGACIKVTVRNRLPIMAPDLATFATQQTTVIRDRNSPQGPTTFNNNLIRASSHVGFHTQLLKYDMSRDDGMNVGVNPSQTVAPGASRIYTYYAGDLELEPRGGNGVFNGLYGNKFKLEARPIEFGAAHIQPADLVKQGQKGLVGAFIIGPKYATVVPDAGTRMQATVTAPGVFYRDFAMVFQKGVNLRYRNGSPVPNIAGEGFGVPEDAHDGGAAAINFSSEPMWFRFGYPADADWGMGGVDPDTGVNMGPGLASIPDAHRGYSNIMTEGLDPQTPVYTAKAGQEMRFRIVAPAGYARGSTLGIAGHNWQREPFTSSGSGFSDVMGYDEGDEYTSSQDNIAPPNTWNVMVAAGGPFGVTGDYLFRDLASFGNLNGLWGIVRVEE